MNLDALLEKMKGLKVLDDTDQDVWKFSRPKIGDVLIFRFLPQKMHLEALLSGEECDSPLIETIFVHSWRSRADGSIWKRIICPKTFDPEAYCPICNYASKAYSLGDKEEGNTFRKYKVYAVNAALVKVEKASEDSYISREEGQIRIFEFGYQVWNEISKGEEDYGLKLFSPGVGHNFKLIVTEKKTSGGSFPFYGKSKVVVNPSKLSEDLGITDEELVSKLDKSLRNIKDYYSAPSKEELQNLCLEEGISIESLGPTGVSGDVTNVTDKEPTSSEGSKGSLDEKDESTVLESGDSNSGEKKDIEKLLDMLK